MTDPKLDLVVRSLIDPNLCTLTITVSTKDNLPHPGFNREYTVLAHSTGWLMIEDDSFKALNVADGLGSVQFTLKATEPRDPKYHFNIEIIERNFPIHVMKIDEKI